MIRETDRARHDTIGVALAVKSQHKQTHKVCFPRRGVSNEYPRCMYLLRNKKKKKKQQQQKKKKKKNENTPL